MTSHHFLFTYSVSPHNANLRTDKDISDDMRRKIAQISEFLWTKLTNVETTFSGTIFLEGDSVIKKRIDARKQVIKVIKDLLIEHDSYVNVNVNVALMVNGLGECMEFKI